MTVDSNEKNVQRAALYFFLSTVITWYFIEWSPVYIDVNQKILSCCIAGAKWNIQMIAALIFMDERRWLFLKNIGKTCLMGSLILIPYSISCLLGMESGIVFFAGSLCASVTAMIVSYYIHVKNMHIGFLWFAGWLLCLAVAVSLQLALVFDIQLL
ncbi:hypothetical protein [Cytophaga hutchinsonii]|uniref:Uncharacterized protein n=1 Tax=Cytophaga hutchinsonii (strain ATCC 33406 / DSM 1761 / CIP 103989 / NBRC 15051 / NCIMB 9469 / D465) TaxID=269798 RepID=A0A6N4STP4_CYTH3|nr:hypothetical protein [Cytophaga hutchinsonii]ABG59824.1 hypothetical protein CHU_2571 [Cytophaga hutchinsonii ATCC 33406]SFX29212.1 hypothetical protein SAMN04487930_102480 [Cytophaga hutchinsonii ATCC 33406]